MLIAISILFLYIIVITSIIYFNNKISTKKTNNNSLTFIKKNEFNGTLNNQLLTGSEFVFYKKLKKITDKYNLLIFSKVRLADIIKTYDYENFNKIKSMHIDFIVCDEFSNFLVFIELDDYTHKYYKNYKNDMIKDNIFKNFNLKIYRINVDDEDNKLNKLEEVFKNKYSNSKINKND